MELAEIKKRIIPILKKYKIKKAGIFGSFAKQHANQRSDLDIVVELGAKISLLEFVGIKLELEDATEMKIDLVEHEAIKPALKERILNEQIPII